MSEKHTHTWALEIYYHVPDISDMNKWDLLDSTPHRGDKMNLMIECYEADEMAC